MKEFQISAQRSNFCLCWYSELQLNSVYIISIFNFETKYNILIFELTFGQIMLRLREFEVTCWHFLLLVETLKISFYTNVIRPGMKMNFKYLLKYYAELK